MADNDLQEMHVWVEDNPVRLVVTRIALAIVFLVAAFAVPTGAFFGVFKPESENIATWFQRSGSICVLFAVSAEYFLQRLNGMFDLSGVIFTGRKSLIEKFGGIYKALQFSAVVTAVVGTLIWGYGDLLSPGT